MRHVLLVSFIISIVSSCTLSVDDHNDKHVNSNFTRVEKQLNSFTQVKSNSSIDIEIVVDKNAASSCEIIGDKEIVSNVAIIQNNKEVTVEFKEMINTKSKEVKVILHTNGLEKIDAAGSGDITVNGNNTMEYFEAYIHGSGDIDILNLESAKANFETEGSGDIDIEGKCTNASYISNGSGAIDGSELICADVTANTHGSGDITVNAEKTLDAYTYGSANIYYIGNPILREKTIGSGSVIKK